MPHRSSVPLLWRLKESKYKMVSAKCKKCDIVHFPPRTLCTQCGGPLEKHQLSGLGKIISYTVVRTPPEGFEKNAPYVVAIIELCEGTFISGQIVSEIDKVEVGKDVRPVFRRIYEDGPDGLISYGFKFELVEE